MDRVSRAARRGSAKPSLPRLHVVTDDGLLAGSAFPGRAEAVLDAGRGGLALHLRGREITSRGLLSLYLGLEPLARESGSLLVVNDRVDLAMVAGAEAVQLGSASLPARAARRLLGPDALIGVSVHGPADADTDADAEADADAGGVEGADYLLAGTVYPSASHPEGSVQGVSLVSAVRAVSALPVVAIGGIRAEAVGEVLAAGAHGVAVIRAVWGAPDPGAAVLQLLAALDG